MEVILWGIFIITTLLGACIMMIQENPERYNRYIVEYGIGLFWVIMYIYLLDVYFLGIYYKKFLITLIALAILFSIFSSFYYEEGRDYGKNEKIILEKEDEVETRKYLKSFYRGLNISPALIPINRDISKIVIGFFEFQILVDFFILRFSDILLKRNFLFYNLIFFILLFFIERRIIKVIVRYKDYSLFRQIFRYFMLFSVLICFVKTLPISNNIKVNKNSYHSEKSSKPEKNLDYSQPQQDVKPVIVENKREREEVAQQNNIQTSSNYDYDLEVLGKVYDEVINRGNESYLENFSSEELAIIRNTLYARKGYQFKKKEYQEYFGQKSWYNPTTTNQNILTKNEERLANIIKGYENNTNTRTSNTSEIGYENKFGRVVNDKYVGGSFIEFLRNADENEYYYLRDQFWEILDTMYVTEDNKTYYYLNDIIDQLETKADWDNSSRVISLEVKGNKMYYTVGFPKGYNANTPSWVQFEIFERKFNDGIGLRTAHVSCAINGVEYKDWEAVNTIFR